MVFLELINSLASLAWYFFNGNYDSKEHCGIFLMKWQFFQFSLFFSISNLILLLNSNESLSSNNIVLSGMKLWTISSNLKTGVTRKQSTPNFRKNEHFLTPDTHMWVGDEENLACFVFL